LIEFEAANFLLFTLYKMTQFFIKSNFSLMITTQFNILLADDDTDDCLFFKEALDELPLSTHLTTVYDGEQLMQQLTENMGELPHVIFLDINMPRKKGCQCLSEIKRDNKLKQLPIVVFSTSFDKETVNEMYENGAHYYLRKPNSFPKLKQVISQALTNIEKYNFLQPPKDNFVIVA
jgi:CheY-like chemotaxis protein